MFFDMLFVYCLHSYKCLNLIFTLRCWLFLVQVLHSRCRSHWRYSGARWKLIWKKSLKSKIFVRLPLANMALKLLCEEGYNFGKPPSQRLWKNSRWWKTETESWSVCLVGRIPFPYFTPWGRYGTVAAKGQRQSPELFVWWANSLSLLHTIRLVWSGRFLRVRYGRS